MISSYKKKANYGIWISLATFIIQIVFGFMALGQITQGNESFINNPVISIIGLVGYISLFVGIYYYAKAKGYSGWFALLGFLYLIGLIIMFLLKDKTDTTSKSKSNKLVIVFIIVIFAIIALGALSKLALKKIDPGSILIDSTVTSCTSKCQTNGDSSNQCILSCLQESRVIEAGDRCSTQCAEAENVGQCVKECVFPRVSPSY